MADGATAGNDKEARLCLTIRGAAAEGLLHEWMATNSMSWLVLWQAESGDDVEAMREQRSLLLAEP
jgi:hypothetical protein